MKTLSKVVTFQKDLSILNIISGDDTLIPVLHVYASFFRTVRTHDPHVCESGQTTPPVFKPD